MIMPKTLSGGTRSNSHGLRSTVPVLWMVDRALDLPVAVIEDTADGMGVIEIGERTAPNLAIAQKIVDAHNATLRLPIERE